MNLIMQDISRPAVRQAIRRELADPAAILQARQSARLFEMGTKAVANKGYQLQPHHKPGAHPGSWVLRHHLVAALTGTRSAA